MGVTVLKKTIKKQSANAAQAAPSQRFEQSLMALEDICLEIKEGEFTHGKTDTDRLYWQQKIKNIVMPLSLALSEYKGPRVFHQHYKHDENDNQKMIPVMESARDNLLNVCERSLHACENLIGMKGSQLLEERTRLIK